MVKFKELKSQLSVNVVVSVIMLYLIEPFLKLLWRLIVEVSAKTYSGYIDLFYKNAAEGTGASLDLIVFGFLLLFFWGFVVKTFIDYLFLINKIKLKRVVSFESETTNKVKLLKENIEKADKNLSFFENNLKAFSIFNYFFLISSSLVIIHVSLSFYSAFSIEDTFKSRLIILAPYIDSQKEEELRSEWKLVSTRKDYIKLDAELLKIASQNNIALPQPIFN